MSRTERLLDLIQLLRGKRVPVSGPALAAGMGISIRTLYRDIATLQAQGADIQGEPGVGYVLRPGFLLPPLMFSADEIEALVLGTRWVERRAADDRLSAAAGNALTKIGAVLPQDMRDSIEAATLLVGGGEKIAATVDLGTIRIAMRNEHKIVIGYRTTDGSETRRTIWPIAIGFFDQTRVVAGWCELREDFRNFRIDRITSLETTEQRYPRRRAVLVKAWRATQNIPNS